MALIVIALAVALLALFCLDIAFGDTHIPLSQVLDVLTGGGTRSQRFIVLESRSLQDASRAQLWLNGSLNSADRTELMPAALALAVVALVAVGSARTLAAAFGAPFLLYLLVRMNRKATLS